MAVSLFTASRTFRRQTAYITQGATVRCVADVPHAWGPSTMPSSASSPPDLAPRQRREQLVKILARGVLRHLRERRSEAPEDSTESVPHCLDVHTEFRLNVRGVNDVRSQTTLRSEFTTQAGKNEALASTGGSHQRLHQGSLGAEVAPTHARNDRVCPGVLLACRCSRPPRRYVSSRVHKRDFRADWPYPPACWGLSVAAS